MSRRRRAGGGARGVDVRVGGRGLPGGADGWWMLLLVMLALLAGNGGLAGTARADSGSDRAASLRQAGVEHLTGGEPGLAYESLTAALQLYKDRGDIASSAQLLSDMGKIQTDLSHYPLAIERLLRALRLAIVKKILDLHGIGIEVSGEAGEFVSFSFVIPFATAEDHATGSGRPGQSASRDPSRPSVGSTAGGNSDRVPG